MDFEFITPGQPLMMSSGAFWLVMIVFLPVLALVGRRRRLMTVWVTAVSVLMAIKGSGALAMLMLLTAAMDWMTAHAMSKTDDPVRKRVMLWTSIACSVGLLAYFKYANFALATWHDIVGGNFSPLDLVLPVGISFYTFRTISYVVDVYKGKMQPVDSLLDYVFYLTFFPCMVAGPIVRARDFMPQLEQWRPAVERDVWDGVWQFLVGLVKKAVVADYIAQYTAIVYGNTTGYSGVELLVAVVGYAVQIYMDFSGYSDMAIGLGRVMGFDLGVNFDLPYRSRNVTEFWRRWHISLSFWLRDYIYISLGGNRKGKVRQHLNLLATMLVGGLWHGASWNFVLWGAGHGVALCIHKLLMPRLKAIEDTRWVTVASVVATCVVVAVLWVPFATADMATAGDVLGGVFSRWDWAYIPVMASVRPLLLLVIMVAIASHYMPVRWLEAAKGWFVEARWWWRLAVIVAVVQLVLQFAGEDVQPFLYASF